MSRYESLRIALEEVTGKKLIHMFDVETLLRKSGHQMTIAGIERHFKSVCITPRAVGIEPMPYGLKTNPKYYPREEVWKYFLELGQRRKVYIAGFSNLEELAQEWGIGLNS